MTVAEAIDRMDAMKPNSYTQREKVRWLATLDGIVDTEIIRTHEEKIPPFIPYTERDVTRELLVKAPYDEIYLHYLAMQIDYANGEYGDYNNDMLLYTESYRAFMKQYNKTHMPKGRKWKFF